MLFSHSAAVKLKFPHRIKALSYLEWKLQLELSVLDASQAARYVSFYCHVWLFQPVFKLGCILFFSLCVYSCSRVTTCWVTSQWRRVWPTQPCWPCSNIRPKLSERRWLLRVSSALWLCSFCPLINKCQEKWKHERVKQISVSHCQIWMWCVLFYCVIVTCWHCKYGNPQCRSGVNKNYKLTCTVGPYHLTFDLWLPHRCQRSWPSSVSPMWPTVLLEAVFSLGSLGASGGGSRLPASCFRTPVSASSELSMYLDDHKNRF